MADKATIERVNAMLKENQEAALAFGCEMSRRYPECDNPAIIDDTPYDLKAKEKIPGALFNKRMRPIPLGTH